jgi:hypothetical protein
LSHESVAEYEVRVMAQQQKGYGQVNVIINVAMGVFLAPHFLS